MCGRFTQKANPRLIADLFGLEEIPELEPRYNIAPSQQIASIGRRPGESQNRLAWMEWGLIPSWSKEAKPSHRPINARAETVFDKPMFRSLIRNRRCLIPADGFFEWKKTAGGKIPYYIRLKSAQPFAFAGLWDCRLDSLSNKPNYTCTILTTAANDLVRSLHDRMPVIVPPEAFDHWLDQNIVNACDVSPLLTSFPADLMECFPVRTIVNSPQYDGPECIEKAQG